MTVFKQVVPADAPPGTTTGASPQGGWTFAAAGSAGLTVGPASGTTADGTGAADFLVTFPGSASGNVTLTETTRTGFELQQVGGANAVCHTGSGEFLSDVAVTNVDRGFTVSVSPNERVFCTLYNRALPTSVRLEKTWVVNGTSYPEGRQPFGLKAIGTVNGRDQAWDSAQTGFSPDESVAIGETTDLTAVPLCTLDRARLTDGNGSTLDLNLPSAQTLIPGPNEFTITNTVTCASKLQLVKTVVGGNAPASDWILSASHAGSPALTGRTGVNDQVTPDVQYVLSEDDPHPQYVQFVDTGPSTPPLIPGSSGSWNCQEVEPDGSTVIPGFSQGASGDVFVPLGRYVRCEAVNQTSTLTLQKVVQNSHGGSATPSDWRLTATPTGSFPAGLPTETVTGSTTGESVNLRPGVAYSLTESAGPGGYTLDSVTCNDGSEDSHVSSVTLDPLKTVTCTFTNVDQPAQLTLVKQVTNNNGGTAVPADWTLRATGPTTITGTSGSPAVTNAVVDAGTYTLAEANGPLGYTGSWACTAGSLTGSTLVLGSGESATCTLTNDDQPAHLTLVKQVTNDNGGTAAATDWTLRATGPSTITGTSGSPAVTNAAVNAGTYALAEANGPAGYTAGTWSCTGANPTGSTLVLGNNVSATCTITNDDQPAHLTLVKSVTNDNGGTAGASDWVLSATGPTTITGRSGEPPVTNAAVNAGTYTLTETGGPAGYTPGDWSCTGGTLTASTLVLRTGVSATCTITNDDQAAHLTLVKHVTNDNGGTAVPTDWTLGATGPTRITGRSGSGAVTDAAVKAGTYSLTEANGPPGYAGGWSCTAGTLTGSTLVLGSGVTATCTITNNDQPAHLTLVKRVTNGDSGGTATPARWTLTATGPTPVSGAGNSAAVTDEEVNAGSYTLSESGGPPGYEAGTWSCVGASLTGHRVIVPSGGEVTCAVTNTALEPTLTLVMVVDDNGSGAGTPAGAWTLSAIGPRTISGASGAAAVSGVPVPVGTYDLLESGPAGYRTSDWVCTGAAGFSPGGTVTLALGNSAVCTLTSTASRPTLTLVKVVDNGDSGGSALATDWTLNAVNGSSEISGVSGSAGVTQAAGRVGTYTLGENGPGGYRPSGWTCSGALTSTVTSVTLAVGNHATCRITNTAQQAHLTLVTDVVNDNGGTAVPSDWTLGANGPTSGISGTTGAGSVTGVPVAAGSYALTESGPDGYSTGAWSCRGGVLQGTTVSIGLGADVTCILHNNDLLRKTTLSLSPDKASTPVGSIFTVTAVLRRAGKPVADVRVHFVDRMGGHEDRSGAGSTDPEGHAAFPYTRAAAGNDTVRGTATVDGQSVSATIRHAWTAVATRPPENVPPTSTMVSAPEVARPGGDIAVSGTGCRSGQTLRLYLGETELGTTRAAADGSFYLRASVPDLPLGRYTLSSSCGATVGDPTVDLTAPQGNLGVAGIAAVGATTASTFIFFLLLGKGVLSMARRMR